MALRHKEQKNSSRTKSSLRLGAVSFVFLIVGYQVALFVHSAAVESIIATHDRPDTVYVCAPADVSGDNETVHHESGGDGGSGGKRTCQEKVSGRSQRDPRVEQVISKASVPPPAEAFRFNPNTASVQDLIRLGFSRKQAESIENYRAKGGFYRRKSDFAKSFVVSEQMYERLKDYIDIPLLDINAADSAAFDSLPGIGPYFAAKMVSYRSSLGGYSFKEQLMEIWNLDKTRFNALQDLISVGPCDSLDFWSMSVDELKAHPYIRNHASARSIVFFREHNPRTSWSIDALRDAGILPDSTALKLSRCRIRQP